MGDSQECSIRHVPVSAIEEGVVSFRKCASGVAPPSARATAIMIPMRNVENGDLVMIGF